LLITVRLTK